MNSRLSMTMRNAFWSYFSMIASMLIHFVSRTVFVYYLGKDYLGINGLFSNILGVLSFTELGIGTAINFSLYKPVAEGNREKIKAYMYCYKWANRIIGSVILVLGLLLIPFLDKLVKDPGNIGNITVYYLIALFNTVTTYFISYKYTLVNAEQKNYIFTNINLIISLTTTCVQIISLVVWHDYLAYLLVAAVFGLGQKVFVNRYLNRLYPYLKEKNVEKLSKDEKATLVRKVKAMMAHKLGDVSVHQTDNIIVSAFVNVGTVGLLSNYNLLIDTVSSCINILFSSVTGSLGNLVATESEQKQYEVFRTYRFIGFWFYGFTSIALMVLSSPFITLWLGSNMVVDDLVIGLILVNYYMIGHRVCLNNFKLVGGVVEQDKYLAVVQAVVNLASSVLLVRVIGLPGVYVGTILQGSIASAIKPIVVYRNMFHVSSKFYFIDSVKYLAAVVAAFLICWYLRMAILTEVTVLRFAAMMMLVAVIPNLLFAVCFHRRSEFRYVVNMIKRIIKKQV